MNIYNWSVLGRHRQTKIPHLQSGAGGQGESTFAEKSACAGRLVCDTWKSAKELLKSKDYRLATLVKTQLDMDKQVLDAEDIPNMFNSAQLLGIFPSTITFIFIFINFFLFLFNIHF